MTIPHRLLPLCLRVVQASRKALWRVGDVLAEVERSLVVMREPNSVDDLVRSHPKKPTIDCGACGETVYQQDGGVVRISGWCKRCGTSSLQEMCRRCEAAIAAPCPRVCIDCGTSDPVGLCDSCAVLGTGRIPS